MKPIFFEKFGIVLMPQHIRSVRKLNIPNEDNTLIQYCLGIFSGEEKEQIILPYQTEEDRDFMFNKVYAELTTGHQIETFSSGSVNPLLFCEKR